MKSFITVLVIVLSQTSALGEEIPRFSKLKLYAEQRDPRILGISLFEKEATKFKIYEEAQVAAKRLEAICHTQVTTEVELYSKEIRLQPSVKWMQAIAGVAFSLQSTAPTCNTITSVFNQYAHQAKEIRHSFQVPILATTIVKFPDGGEVSTKSVKFYTRTVGENIPAYPRYFSLKDCLQDRTNAEKLVASDDPRKQVFWSTCHASENQTQLRYYMKIHYAK